MSAAAESVPEPVIAEPRQELGVATCGEVEKKEEPWKRYYEAHREQVLAIQKEKKRWLTYYERHQDEVRERNRLRYYAKQGRDAPPRKERKKKDSDAPTDDKIDRLAELLAEMRVLVPSVMKPVKEPKAKGKAKASPVGEDDSAAPAET
jgi:hypothetical protein